MKSERKLRILVFSSHFYPKLDGTVRAIDKIINTLNNRGHNVFLITRRLRNTPRYEVYKQVEIYRIGPSGHSLVTRLLLGFNQARLAMNIIRDRGVDILQAHGFSSMVACSILSTIFRIPIVMFFHGLPRMWGLQFKWRKPYEHLLSYPIERLLLRKAGRIVVRSELFAKVLVNIYGHGYEERIRILQHSVDTDIFSFRENISTEPIILFVGSLARVYGVDLILKAAPLVLEKARGAKFVIVGDGPLDLYLKKLAQELGIERSVQFIGRIDEPLHLARYYHMSTVVVIPLYYKGYILSLVAVEALACGRPVITTMMLEPGLERVGVFTVKTYNPEDLAQSILYVLEKVDLKSLAFSARRYVEKYHSGQTYGSKLEGIYLELIHQTTSKTNSPNSTGDPTSIITHLDVSE